MMQGSPKRIIAGPEKLEWLAKVLMLSGKDIPEADSRQLFANLPSICLLLYAPGMDVLKEGDYSKDFFVVNSGSLSVLKKKALSPAVEVARLGPGDFFGELGFLLGVSRSATVRAAEDSLVFRFCADEFEEVLAKNKPLSRRVRKLALERIEKNLMEGL